MFKFGTWALTPPSSSGGPNMPAAPEPVFSIAEPMMSAAPEPSLWQGLKVAVKRMFYVGLSR
jgi:hypothetical protein